MLIFLSKNNFKIIKTKTGGKTMTLKRIRKKAAEQGDAKSTI